LRTDSEQELRRGKCDGTRRSEKSIIVLAGPRKLSH
jgi:hypothetical protein